jgi:Holliday junction resolvase
VKTHGGAYQRSGIPDLLYLEEGIFYAFEVKRSEKEKPTPLQIHELELIREAGGVAHVVRSVDEVRDILDGRWDSNKPIS